MKMQDVYAINAMRREAFNNAAKTVAACKSSTAFQKVVALIYLTGYCPDYKDVPNESVKTRWFALNGCNRNVSVEEYIYNIAARNLSSKEATEVAFWSEKIYKEVCNAINRPYPELDITLM